MALGADATPEPLFSEQAEALLASSLAEASKCEDGNPLEKVFHVKDHVFLGTRFGAQDEAAFRELDIHAVVNLTAGSTRVPNHFQGMGIEYLHVELTDELLSNPCLAMPEAYRAIHRWGLKESRRRVLVHCSAGLSRSATAVLCWLMRDLGLSLAEAKDLVKAKRGRRPRCNPSFWCYLSALEREIRGWPGGTQPSFDFTRWLMEDLRTMGMVKQERSIIHALQVEADWVDFAAFYTALGGPGLKVLMSAQRIAQKEQPDVKMAGKAMRMAIELMEVYHGWAAVVCFCLRVVQPLLAHPDRRLGARALSAGIVAKTLTAMQEHSSVVDVQEACVALFAYFGAFSAECSEEVQFHGGLPLIIASMAAHRRSAEVQATGCIAVTTLSSSPACRADIVQKGGAEAVMAAMRTHPDNVKVQLCGCRALSSLAASREGVVQTVRLGGIELLTTALELHSNCAGVQQYGNEAIASLRVASLNRVTTPFRRDFAVVSQKSEELADDFLQDELADSTIHLSRLRGA